MRWIQQSGLLERIRLDGVLESGCEEEAFRVASVSQQADLPLSESVRL